MLKIAVNIAATALFAETIFFEPTVLSYECCADNYEAEGPICRSVVFSVEIYIMTALYSLICVLIVHDLARLEKKMNKCTDCTVAPSCGLFLTCGEKK